MTMPNSINSSLPLHLVQELNYDPVRSPYVEHPIESIDKSVLCLQKKIINPIDIYLFGHEEQEYLHDIDQCDVEKQKYVN